jgi:hypothetical protein
MKIKILEDKKLSLENELSGALQVNSVNLCQLDIKSTELLQLKGDYDQISRILEEKLQNQRKES